ncbi:MAG TPA: sarcosine oxidase subunit delta [Actinomycetota bacterium]|jgi:heterotetrameric sarcosine oxidase delta subunit|nr:sarcosine oxidase subunit delta [Actinomycetota bacterium]
MAVRIPCPSCGWRPSSEFTWGGELRPLDAADAEADFERVFLPANVQGLQEERWFHRLGCRRWTTIRRDTRTNEVG